MRWTTPDNTTDDARERMVREQLVARGIRDRRVIEVMGALTREAFVHPRIAVRAYDDAALPVECNQTISQPYMVARMTELLWAAPDDRVLEVGTGTGYQTAILAALAGQVFTVERHRPLLEDARARLDELGYSNVRYRCGDGTEGWPEAAPFDAILVTAGAPSVPAPLVDQLCPGGRLVIPVGNESEQNLLLGVRVGDTLQHREVLPCRFVKLVGSHGWAPGDE